MFRNIIFQFYEKSICQQFSGNFCIWKTFLCLMFVKNRGECFKRRIKCFFVARSSLYVSLDKGVGSSGSGITQLVFFPPCPSSTIVLFVTSQWSSLRCHDKIQQPLTESCTFFNPGQGPKVKIAPEKLQKHLILSKCYETSKWNPHHLTPLLVS